MTRYFRRRALDRRETLKAAALGVGAGMAAAASAFYLARIFMGREVLGSPSDPEAPGSEARSTRPPGGTRRSSGP